MSVKLATWDRVPLKVQKDFGLFLSPFHFPRIAEQRQIQ